MALHETNLNALPKEIFDKESRFNLTSNDVKNTRGKIVSNKKRQITKKKFEPRVIFFNLDFS